LDELWWGLFKSSYRLLTGSELTGAEYKYNVDIWRANWPVVRRIADEILGWERLRVVESVPAVEVVREAMDLIDRSPVAPRDAFHLALTLRHQIPALVTADRDFERIDLPRGSELTIVRI
jgi:predicted nucleic acid-binding protein